MERRRFFKSLGLLSLAAVIPKFLFGKKEEPLIYKITDKGKSERTISWESQYSVNNKLVKTGVLYVDRNIIPDGVKISNFIDKLKNEPTLLYSSKKIGYDYRPANFRQDIIDGNSRFVKISGNIINPLKLAVIDVGTNWSVDHHGFCNYMSIQRHPIYHTSE